MAEILKKRAVKAAVTQIIIAIVVIAACLGIQKLGILDYIKGPVVITEKTDMSKMEGKYVTFEAKYVIGEYVREYSKYKKTGKEVLNKIGYVVIDDANESIFGVTLPSSKEKEMNKMMDDFASMLYGEIEDVSTSLKISGTVEKMSGEQKKYFDETISEFIGDTSQDGVFALDVEQDTINGFPVFGLFLLTAVAGLALLYIIYLLIRTFSGSYDKNLKKYLDEHQNVSMPNLEADFAAAQQIGKNVWIGSKWTFFMQGVYAKIILNEEIVWAYYYQRTGKGAESKVKLFDINKKETDINVSSSESDQILEIYGRICPRMVTGYSKELETCFNKDFTSFLAYNYNKTEDAAATQETEF